MPTPAPATPISPATGSPRPSAAPEFLLYGHGGYANRGCEAIVRATAAMLRRAFPGRRIVLASMRPDSDRAQGVPGVDDYVVPARRDGRALDGVWARRLGWRLLRRFEAMDRVSFGHLAAYGARAGVSLSVGGDNYCYGRPSWLYAIDRLLKESGTRLVLWGASIEPSAIDRRMREDLLAFDAINARESLTVEGLARAGIHANVHLHPDPAFTLEPVETPLPQGWRDRELLGLNLSPLAVRHERAPGVALRAVHRLIEHALRTTPLSVLLVPHVTWAHDDDSGLLADLAAHHAATGRVALAPAGLTAPEYKSLVSKCALFVGARTHATIAAYSSLVPTLVLGYSVKARGIARDLFGDEDLVLPVQALEDDAGLARAFDALRERRAEVATRLRTRIPEVIARAGEAVERLRPLVA